MQKMLTVFLPQICESRTQKNKLNGIEKVGLSTTISPHNHVVLGTKRLNLLLIPKAAKTADDYLLDVHGALGSKVRGVSLVLFQSCLGSLPLR